MAYLDIRYKLDLETTSINGSRYYETPDGRAYPSVTTVLGRYKEPSLLAWKQRIGFAEADKIANKAADFGTKIHEMCEAYILGQPLPEHNHFHKSRFEIMKKLIDEDFGAVYALEAALYSHKLKTAGRTDVIGQFRGIPSVIDFKNANKPKKKEWIDNYFYQGAAYSYMYYELTKDEDTTPRQIVIVVSVEHENEPQIFIEPVASWISPMINLFKQYGDHEKPY